MEGRAMMAVAHPKLALRPFLPADAPLLREIFRDSIEELTNDDYTEAQQEAWASVADDVGEFRNKLSGQLTLVATLEGSPVGFASLEGKDKIDMLYVHPAATGQGVGAMLIDALEKLRVRAVRQGLPSMRATARAAFSKSGATSPSSGIQFRLATSGSPTPRCKSNLPLNGRLHDQTRHAFSASLALLHRAQIRSARCRCGDRALCRLPVDLRTSMKRHHVMMGVIAIVIAIALLSNYYLW